MVINKFGVEFITSLLETLTCASTGISTSTTTFPQNLILWAFQHMGYLITWHFILFVNAVLCFIRRSPTLEEHRKRVCSCAHFELREYKTMG